MKCTNNKLKGILSILLAVILLSGCGKDIVFEHPYSYADSAVNIQAKSKNNKDSEVLKYFAEDLCVTNNVNTESEAVTDRVVLACGVFLPDKKEVSYQKNIYDHIHPASTTKVMTCYLALTYGNLNDYITVSANAVDQASDSSVCGLMAGDNIKLSELLYGLMLRSGNDAAVAVAEYVSGSVEEFADLMNETAKSWGATNTHFVNPHGLTDENHYTTVYDMYLIMSHCIQNEDFLKYISTKSYTAYYTNSAGIETSQTWSNTNRYVSGTAIAPSEVTVVGGKTGTTYAAGSCLVLYSTNSEGAPVISIIYKSDGADNLYYVMNQLLSNFVL